MTTTRLFKHNPAFLTEEELASSFVVRGKELQLLLNIVRENTGPVNQHVIIIGPRGTGKTMLSRRLALAVRKDEHLNRIWYPVVLPEEVYDVAGEGELWLRVLEFIIKQEKEAGRDYHRWLQSYETVRGERDGRKLQIHSLTILSEFTQQQGFKLLVVLENLQIVLGVQSSSDEAWNLRRTLSNNPEIMLVATATTHFEEIVNVKKANYELFREIPLDSLSTYDCRILWHSVAGEDLVKDRIRPMEILTGGSPRLLSILADFAKGRSLAQLMDELVILIDDHTTYFKANVESLPPMERRVFVTLAELWEPAEARQVAGRCRLAVNKTSALLNKLVNRGAVTKASQAGRKKLYQVAERLYNIYHLMRLSGIEADRVRALIRFMIPLYGEETIACALAAEACRQDGDRRRLWIEGYKEILTSATLDSQSFERIYQITPKAFLSLPEATDITRKFAEVEFDNRPAEQEMRSLEQKAHKAYQDGDLQSAIDNLNLILLRYENSQDPALREQVTRALFNKGITLGVLGRSEEEISVYDEMIARFADVDEPALREKVAMALNGRAWKVYEKEDHGKVDQAIADMKKAISLNPKNTYRHTLACLLALRSQWDEAFAQARYFADDESMLKEFPKDIIEFFVFAAALGKAEAALQTVRGTKIKSAMEPLIVGLKISAGRTVRAPREVLEVAKDIVKRIEKRKETIKLIANRHTFRPSHLP